MRLADRIRHAIKTDSPFFSLEFFPPRSDEGFQKLTGRIKRLAKLEPMFINVTWRDFANRQRTLELCDWVQNRLGIEVMMHLSCSGLTRGTATKVLDVIKRSGVRNLLVLRGDTPRAGAAAAAAAGKKTGGEGGGGAAAAATAAATVDAAADCDFPFARDLVAFIRAETGNYFGIAVAGFPEGPHNPTGGAGRCTGVVSGGCGDVGGGREAKDAGEGESPYFAHLKAKVSAGANLIITQVFFDVTKYTGFVAACRAHGITVPIFAGVMAPPTVAFLRRVAAHYGVSVPGAVGTKLRMMAHRPVEYNHFITNYLVNMARSLRQHKAPGLHFFTMNVESLVHTVLTKLGFQETVASRRRLPWRSTGRRNEDVRPIFWSNRQQSYLARTSSWGSLPKGRWSINGEMSLSDSSIASTGSTDADGGGGGGEAGDADANDGRVGMTVTERRIHWGNALAYVGDIAAIFVRYLLGQIPCLPWCEEELNPETVTIRDPLIKINRLGFLTINSQPRVCGAPSTDPTFGWGTPGGYVYQKAYVEFFCSAQHLALLMQAVDDDRHSAMTYIASDVRGNMYTNSKFRGPNAVTWGVFVNDEVLQPTVVDHEAFMVWKGEAFSLWIEGWADIYEPDSRAAALIHSIHDSYFLVSVVDNDFMHGNIYALFDAVEQLQAPQLQLAAAAARYNSVPSDLGLDAEARFRAMSSRLPAAPSAMGGAGSFGSGGGSSGRGHAGFAGSGGRGGHGFAAATLTASGYSTVAGAEVFERSAPSEAYGRGGRGGYDGGGGGYGGSGGYGGCGGDSGSVGGTGGARGVLREGRW